MHRRTQLIIFGSIVSIAGFFWGWFSAKAHSKPVCKNCNVVVISADLIRADEQQQKLFEDLEMYQSPCECTT